MVAFTIGYIIMTLNMMKRGRALRTAERLRRPDLFESPDDQIGAKKGEYKSRLTLLGLPLVHAKFAMAEEGDAPAVGWIAAGHKAYGLIFAWGGIAVAPISVGIVSVGIVTVGAIGVGVFSLGLVALGLLSMGVAAIGYKAYASLSAMGWESAFSQGFAIAKDAAIGPVAYAQEVNNELAVSISNLSAVGDSYTAILGIMSLLVIVPVAWYARAVRKNVRKPAIK